MRVLQFGKYYYPAHGGIEHVMFEITEGLNQENGMECDVLCSNTTSRYEENKFGNYTVFRTASYGIIKSTSITPQLIYKLWKLKDRYEIIHVHHPDPVAFFALFLVRPKCKIIVHWHSDIIRQKKLLKYFLPLQNWVLSYCDKVIVTSKTYAKYSPCLEKFQEKIEITPIGITNKTLVADENNVKRIQEKYKNKKIILALGRLVSYKGFKYLVESAKYLNDEFIILIAGTGVDYQLLHDSIEFNNLQNRVKLLGYISEQEKYDYLEASFLFCLPSITKAEAFGVVMLESMAFSKPIVSTNIPESGISWVNKNNISGIQVEPKSSKSLAESFIKIANDKELYKSLCENSLQRYKEVFTRDKMVTSLTRIYNSIL